MALTGYGRSEDKAQAMARAKAMDVEIVPLRDLEPSQRLRDLTDTWAETFSRHWGFVAFDERLRELGWVDGRSVNVDFRRPDKPEVDG